MYIKKKIELDIIVHKIIRSLYKMVYNTTIIQFNICLELCLMGFEYTQRNNTHNIQ